MGKCVRRDNARCPNRDSCAGCQFIVDDDIATEIFALRKANANQHEQEQANKELQVRWNKLDDENTRLAQANARLSEKLTSAEEQLEAMGAQFEPVRQSNEKLLKKLEAATAALGTVPPAIRDAIAKCDVEACIRYGQAADAIIALTRQDAENFRARARKVDALEAIVAEVRVSNGLSMTNDPGRVKVKASLWDGGVPLGEYIRELRRPFIEQRDEARQKLGEVQRELGEAQAALALLKQESLLEKAAQLLDSRGFRAAACVVRVMDRQTRV